jgi:hypothetical protein
MVDWIDNRPLGAGSRGSRACDWRAVFSAKTQKPISRSITLQGSYRIEPKIMEKIDG